MDNAAFLISSASDWLLSGLSGTRHVSPPTWAYWHARFMVIGWTILLPSGMLIARFFKVTSRQAWPTVLDNKFWWKCHIRLQSAGLVFVFLGLAMVYRHGKGISSLAMMHHLCGWFVIVMGIIQLISGLLRGSKGGPTSANMRGDHYDMTPRRVLFEYVHKILGWIAMAVAAFVTGAGLVLVDAPRWMMIVIALWWIAYLLVFAWLQAKGRCLDTYQAIWGASLEHPGNQLKPIGWGIRRRGSPKENGSKGLPPRE
ncbi:MULTISPECIES: cytochrome b561 domain-containing protein [Rhizobium]|uniref:cytochrome b561 domain-containing protein n=1 Tax=Rhizobium TaxID=379 RepID=UPI000A5C61C5|nr:MULTISPECIES: cytochrome b561 domain-containing protein [Rhizobium]